MSNIPEKPANIRATPQQWQAIMERNKNILVSASAGSGKTMVLVQRIMERIKNGDSVDELLVVTFTEAAAKEMKERLRKKLEEEITKTTEPELKQHYINQVYLMGKANISTIHAFCLKVIQRFFYLTNLDPVFSLMSDEIESILLKEKVWRDLQEELFESDPEFINLCRYYSSDRTDDGITELVYQLYDFSRANPDPKKWIHDLPLIYQTGSTWADSPLVAEYIHPILMAKLEQVTTDYDDLLKQVETSGLPEKFSELLLNDAKVVTGVRDLVNALDYDAAYMAANSIKFDRWATLKKDEKEMKPLADSLKKRRDSLKETMNEIIKVYFWESPAFQLAQLHQIAPTIEELAKVVEMFYDALQTEKLRLNKVDFSDLEHMSLQILNTLDENNTPIAANYFREQFVEVLVDEYQDVNRVQETILQAVTRHEKGQENMFMVGDVKQSIYSFRLADPTLFLGKYNDYAKDEGGTRILLAENFRSRSQVLDFTNVIFKQLMNTTLGQMEYDQAAELVHGNKSYSNLQDKHTEILVIENEQEDEPGEANEDQALEEELFDSSAEAEITLIANKMRELIEQQFIVMDPDTGEERPVQYKDMVILAPTKSHNTLISEVLSMFDIPAVVQKTDQYFKRTEITIVLSLLKVIDNPLQDIPLVAVLRSGMVGLTEIELGHIRHCHKKVSYYQAIEQFAKSTEYSDVSYLTLEQEQRLRHKVQHFLSQLQEWRSVANKIPLHQLIWQIYQDTYYLEYVHGQTSGQQRALNLHALYERAKNYETSSFSGLHQFIRFIESMQKQEKDLAEPTSITDDQDAIRVMTIHASKGLEFPVVFMMNAGKRFNLQNVQQSSILSATLGIGTKHIDLERRVSSPTLAHIAVQQERLTKELSEEMRKLYVALTRARDKLYIIGSVKNAASLEKHWAMIQDSTQWTLPDIYRLENKGYLHWIGMALARAKNPNPVNPNQAAIFGKAFEYDLSYYSYQDVLDYLRKWQGTVPTFDSTKKIILPHQLEIKYEQQPINKMLSELTKTYPHLTATQTSSYQSVTEIKRLFEDTDVIDLPQLELDTTATRTGLYQINTLAKPAFMSGEKRASAAEKGTALHLLMQQIDLEEPITLTSVSKTLNQLVTAGVIEKHIAKVLNISSIIQFFATDFGQLLLKNAQNVRREQAFSFILPAKNVFKDVTGEDDLLVHGIIDGYLVIHDEIIVYDFKTDYLRDTPADIKRISDKYKGQLNLYAEALANSLQKPIAHKYLCLLTIGKNVEI
ncbi:DNA helicase/exodeoxyribonuclease V, subunit A [Granulicatella balaenopterae]|uniref:ATP-dependent helicase/nuclease subunit A n=1 Tax=Granulicatella balaenopterae TaxID=137733 RepID=A0A1H9NP62_9LACT|nr:helicase-exonuclease AddAB subunit AddA [Granulicatella balaenopterae]SER37760.1 DNA helicase/exodeoxyribonuclease V, subunit A [Granulicatella balaenopterae]